MQNCTAGDVWMVLQIISSNIRTSRDTFLFSFFFIRTLERYKSIFFGSAQLFWAETEAPHICSSNLITLMGGRVYADRHWRQILQTKEIIASLHLQYLMSIIFCKQRSTEKLKLKAWRLIFPLWWKTKQGVRWILQNCFLCFPLSLSNSNSFAELFLSGLEQELNLWNQSWNSFGSWDLQNFFK